MTEEKTDLHPLQNYLEIEKMTLENFKKRFSKEEIVNYLLENLQLLLVTLLHDEVNRKSLHVLTGISTTGDGGKNLIFAFTSRWQFILEKLYRENRERFYELTFWFFKNFNKFCRKNFEKYFLIYNLIKDTEEFQKMRQ